MKVKIEAPMSIRVSTDLAARLIKEVNKIKFHLSSLNCNLQGMQEYLENVLQLSKETNIEVGKIRLHIDGLKKEGVNTVNKLIKQVDLMNSGVNSFNNNLVVSVQTSYTSFTKRIELSYDTLCRNMPNTFKYFLGRR